jgi:hypothetical protein
MAALFIWPFPSSFWKWPFCHPVNDAPNAARSDPNDAPSDPNDARSNFQFE